MGGFLGYLWGKIVEKFVFDSSALYHLRRFLGWGRERLAKKVGVSATTLRRIEDHERALTLEENDRLLKCIKSMRLRFFRDGESPPVPEGTKLIFDRVNGYRYQCGSKMWRVGFGRVIKDGYQLSGWWLQGV